ncbi:MAG TPA: GNAT family N-acetyltransferase [Azospirillum sp.]|nr:GNAT family N-acetyltransferase [Azospirillum sp.]
MPQPQFIVPQQEHAALILSWRTSQRVTRYMFTDVVHGLPEQEAWLRRCLERTDYRHWLVVHGDRPIGLVNLQDIDWAARCSASGFYIGEEEFLPLGGFILPYLYNHTFTELGFTTMTAEVMEGNIDVMRLHRVHGYVEEEPRPGGIEKDGIVYPVRRFRLTREAWQAQRNFQRYRAAFPWPVSAPPTP